MFLKDSSEDISFPTFDHPDLHKKKIVKRKGKFNKNCLTIIIIIAVLVILIVGVILAVYFSSKKKEDGGFIILHYIFHRSNQNFKLFEPNNLDENDYEVDYNGTIPIRLLSDSKKFYKDPNQCNNGSCTIKITFKRVLSNLEGMFVNIQELKSAYFSGFNSKKIINMNNLFLNCTHLEKVDFSDFNAKNLEKMAHIFENCSSITEINLEDFVTPKLSSMDSAFKGCSNLVSLDIRNFIINSKVELKTIIEGCEHLVDFNYPEEYDEKLGDVYDNMNKSKIFCQKGIDCQKCKNKTKGDSEISICEKCSAGYFKSNYSDLEFQCKKCNTENCNECKDENTCEKCDKLYYLSNDENNNPICLYNDSSTNDTIIETTSFILPSNIPSDVNLL